MIILTGANSDTAKDDDGNIYKNFSFKGIIQETVRRAEAFGYTPVVYDLGSLGIGTRFHVDDDSFSTKGYYDKEVRKGYKSKSLFKPEMVKSCMSLCDDLIVYLDGDALLCDHIDEVEGDDYDVGVTLRERSELESEWHQDHAEIVKYINAGVIFFNPTQATKNFLDIWEKSTEEVGNDQKALNKLTCPDHYPDMNSVLTINGVRIKYFPCLKYNYYYFNEGFVTDIKIMHFKGPVRNFYPFDWKKQLYCIAVIPPLNKLKCLAKKILSIVN